MGNGQYCRTPKVRGKVWDGHTPFLSGVSEWLVKFFWERVEVA